MNTLNGLLAGLVFFILDVGQPLLVIGGLVAVIRWWSRRESKVKH